MIVFLIWKVVLFVIVLGSIFVGDVYDMFVDFLVYGGVEVVMMG